MSLQGVVVTMVLAMSALQFMYDFPPAAYLNVVQQVRSVRGCDDLGSVGQWLSGL
jgi:hypothetical protein